MMSRLIPLVAIIFALVVFFVYVNPTRTGSIAATNAQISSYDSALAAADHFKSKESQLVVARANVPSDGLARLAAFLPDGVDNVQIILDLNTLAARSGITLSNFSTSQNASSAKSAGGGSLTVPGSVPTSPTDQSLGSQGPIDSLDITVSATGTYASFRKFLDGIEHSLRILDVVNVKIHDSTSGVYTYDMTIRVYWLR